VSARRLAVLLLALAVAASAQAMSIRELRGLEQADKSGPVYAQYYLIGVMEGLREANDAAVRERHKPAFCVLDRRLEPRMAQSLYQAELQRNTDLYEADMPVQLVLSNALRNAYRCP
jgi:hypothetical protein